MTSQQEFAFQLHQHARKGGKTHRRRQIQRVWRFLRWAGVPAQNVSRRQINEFYRTQCPNSTTARDYYYAMRLMWRALGRNGDPPYPN
jgi:hypothetical protein